MNNIMLLINNIGSAAIFLAVFPALWISARIILRNYAGENWIFQFFFWLSLTGLVLAPFMDFIRYLGYVLNLIIPSADKFNPISVFLGMAPYVSYTSLSLILGITVYSLSFYYARNLVDQGRFSFKTRLELRDWELIIVLLGIAGLVNRAVGGIVVNFVNLYFPNLTAQLGPAQLSIGFWITWLIGFLILIVTLFFMRQRFNRSANKLPSRTD